ncbi:hypothetical protein ACTFIU_006704 [Dictyostelium citrinum]
MIRYLYLSVFLFILLFCYNDNVFIFSQLTPTSVGSLSMSIVDKNPKFNLYPKRSSLDVCTIVYNILVVEESNTNIIELVQFNSSFITPNPIKLILKDTNKSLYTFSIGQVIPGNYKLGLTATSASSSSNFTLSFTCNCKKSN